MSSSAGDDLCTARGKRQRQIKTFGLAVCFQGVVFGSLSEDNFLGGLVLEDRKSNLGGKIRKSGGGEQLNPPV